MRTILILSLLPSVLRSQEAGDIVPLSFIHWNDFHAANVPYEIKPSAQDTFKPYRVGGSAVLKAYVDSLRTVLPNPLAVYGGDDFQGSPISGLTRGRSQIDLLGMIRPDILTVGNHEFDYSDSVLEKHLSASSLDFICSNVYSRATDTTLVRPFVVRSVGGLRVAFIGGMTNELYRVSFVGNLTRIRLKPINEAIRSNLEFIRRRHGPIDLFVAVTHNGLDRDSLLAVDVPELDVIIGGHSHTVMRRASKVGKTLIVQAGSRGRYVGQLELMYSVRSKRIASYSYRLIETRVDRIRPDSLVAATVDSLEAMVGRSLNDVIGELHVDWKIPWRKESNLGSWEADVFREFAGTDIGLMNTGGLRKELQAGPIRLRDVWEMNPFGNSLVTLSVSGSEVVDMLTHSLNHAESLTQIGGIRYEARRDSGRYRIVRCTVGGKEIDPGRTYTVVMNNYMASHLRDFFGLDPERHPIEELGVLDRDVLIDTIRKQRVVGQPADQRIKFLD